MISRTVITMSSDGSIMFESTPNVTPTVLLGMLEAVKACVIRDHFSAMPRIAIPTGPMPAPPSGK